MKKNVFLILFTLQLFNCNTKIETLNNKDDMIIADSLVKQFYKRLNKDRIPLSKMFDNIEYRRHFVNALEVKDTTLGKIKKAKFNYLTTNRIEYRDSTIIDYYIESEVFYEKGKTKEEVEFRKKIKISV